MRGLAPSCERRRELPENVRKGDEFKFFGFTYWFLLQKLGKENMMGGFVHRDEVRKDGLPVSRLDETCRIGRLIIFR